jgi:hypothetical protein
MNWSHRSNISEGKNMLILINNAGRDLLLNKFVKNGLFCHER